MMTTEEITNDTQAVEFADDPGVDSNSTHSFEARFSVSSHSMTIQSLFPPRVDLRDP